ncbi:MAG: carbohydrate ABC transporter permease, partial [Treponema sp.]|nr:carbohydrate ABC transporter permease [Treponema sp.]
MKNRYESTLKTIMYIFLAVCAFMALYPLFFAVMTSIKTPEEYVTNKLGFPARISFGNYAYVWKNGNMLRYFLNTLLVIPAGLIVYLCICVSAGFAFGRLRFKGRLSLFLAVLFLMIFTQMLLSMQIFQICRTLKLVNNYFGLILVWVAYFTPFGTYIMTTYYSTVPMSLVESARLDGATLYQMLLHIMVPVAQPMIVVITIIGTQ